MIPFLAVLPLTPPVQTSIERSTVLVSSALEDCTGVVVPLRRPGVWVLTAKHCRTHADPDHVSFSDGTEGDVAESIISDNRDLMLLRVDSALPRYAAPLAVADPAPRTPFVTFGRSDDVDWSWGEGYISGAALAVKYKISAVTEQWVMPMACLACDIGGSGGALYDGREVIGIFVAKRDGVPVGYMIPVSIVRAFLREAEKL